MSQVTITFTTDNDAFKDDAFDHEVQFILEQAAKCLEDTANNGIDSTTAKLRDTNGNTVGTVTYSVI